MSQVVARAEAPEIAGVVDPVWAKLRQEAEAAIRQEPSLTSFILTMILNHDTLESAVAHRVAARLGHPTLLGRPHRPDLLRGARGRSRHRRRLPRRHRRRHRPRPGLHRASSSRCSTSRASTPSRRTASPIGCGSGGRHDFALYLQSRSSEVFQTDIHPAARIGRGIFLDHATGLVVGATAVDRGQRLDAAGRDARRHRQGARRPPPQDPPGRADRRRRQDPRQYRGRPMRPRRRGLGRAPAGAAQHHGRGRAGARSSAPPAAPSPRAPWTRSCPSSAPTDARRLPRPLRRGKCPAPPPSRGLKWTRPSWPKSSVICARPSRIIRSGSSGGRRRTISPKFISARNSWRAVARRRGRRPLLHAHHVDPRHRSHRVMRRRRLP